MSSSESDSGSSPSRKKVYSIFVSINGNLSTSDLPNDKLKKNIKNELVKYTKSGYDGAVKYYFLTRYLSDRYRILPGTEAISYSSSQISTVLCAFTIFFEEF